MTVERWTLIARGGPFDGFECESTHEPEPLLIVWWCAGCGDSHGAHDARFPGIDLRSAEPYRRLYVDLETNTATYEPACAPAAPVVADRALAGVGTSSSGPAGGPEHPETTDRARGHLSPVGRAVSVRPEEGRGTIHPAPAGGAPPPPAEGGGTRP